VTTVVRQLLAVACLVVTTAFVVISHAHEPPIAKPGRWINIGPAPIDGGQIGLTGHDRPVTGRVSAVAIDPRDDHHWLVGGAQGGVWETADRGRTWMPLTDDQPSLAIGAIAFHPRDSNTVYVGTGEALAAQGAFPGQGLLKLIRNPETGHWVANVMQIGEAVPFRTLGFSDVLIDPGDPDRLFVATRRVGRDLYDEGDTYITEGEPGRGLIEFAPGKLSKHLAGDVTDLKAHPARFSCMYAGLTKSQDLLVPPWPGVYRRRSPECETGGKDVKGSYTPSGDRPVAPTSGKWTRVIGPWDDVARAVAKRHFAKVGEHPEPHKWHYAIGRVEIAVASNPSVVYVSIARRGLAGAGKETSSEVYNDVGLLGLWRTDNAWAEVPSWVPIEFGQVDGGSGEFGYCGAHPATKQSSLCHWSHVLSVDPRNKNVLYAGGIGLWKAEIGCTRKQGIVVKCQARWSDVSHIAPLHRGVPRLRRRGIHVDQHALAWTPRGDRLVVGNDGGVWSTTNGGRTWSDHNAGLSVVQFYRGAVGELESGSRTFIVAGTQDNGTVRWTGRGWDWLLGGDGGPAVIARDNPAMHWAIASKSVLFGNRIRRTLDGGREFTFADGGMDATDKVLLMPLAECRQAENSVVLAGALTLWKSPSFFTHNATPTWIDNFPERLSAGVTAVAFSPSSDCNTYAFGTLDGRVYLTSNGGRGWCELAEGLPKDRRISGLAFHPKTSTTLYASVWSQPSDVEFGVVAATNAARCSVGSEGVISWPGQGSAWSRMDLPRVLARGDDNGRTIADSRENIRTIAVHPLEPHTLWVGTNAGVWASTGTPVGTTMAPGAKTWVRHNHREFGMPNVAVFDIKISPRTGQVVAFTYGRGAFLWVNGPAGSSSNVSGGWCDGNPSGVVGTNFLPCTSQKRIPARSEMSPSNAPSAP
jgi:photosystem II stability/assembly factor-like uncharacterized protein